MPSTIVDYRYEARPALSPEGDRLALGLPTTDPGTYLAGFAERADVVAAALLRVGDVAATRFYVHPSLVAAAIALADPIITVGEGAVRFESLSACCGVAARLDLLDDGFEASTRNPGTTNVDLGGEARRLLTGVRRHQPLRVVVGSRGLDLQTLEGAAHERTVALPRRWVRSLAELGALASTMTLHAELGAAQAREFLRSVPARQGDQQLWLQPVSGGLRLASSARPGAVSVGGVERLRILQPVLRHATALRVYGTVTGAAAASWWEVTLPGARLGLGLSPAASRGFSGEGALLDDLADGSGDVDRARRGLVGYDLAEGRYFGRVLPFGRDGLVGSQRSDKARALVAAGRVRRAQARILVGGTRGEHAVALGPGGDTCTCRWFADHRGDRGPCAHVLAARIWAGS